MPWTASPLYKWMLGFLVVAILTVLAPEHLVFRPIGLDNTLTAFRALFLFEASGDRTLAPLFAWIFPSLVAVHWISYRGWLRPIWQRLPAPIVYFLLGAGTALALQWAAKDYQPFIYFQF